MTYRIQLFMAGDELSKNMLRTVDKITRLLMERFGPRVKSFLKDYAAYVFTSNALTLNLKQGVSEVVQIEAFFILETYREELKARLNLVDFPAARFGDKTYIGREALEIVSRLYDSLSRFSGKDDDELLAEIKSIAGQAYVPENKVVIERPSILAILQKGVEPAVKMAGKISSSLVRVAQLVASTPSPTAAKNMNSEKSTDAIVETPQPKAEHVSSGSIDKVTFERNAVRAGIAECLAKLEKLREEGRIDDNTYRKMKEIYDSFLS